MFLVRSHTGLNGDCKEQNHTATCVCISRPALFLLLLYLVIFGFRCKLGVVRCKLTKEQQWATASNGNTPLELQAYI